MLQIQVLDFVRTNFRASVGARGLDADTPLFTSGIVDSFGVLELIAFLEQAFGVEIDPARHDLAEFDTVRKIETLIDDLRSAGSQ